MSSDSTHITHPNCLSCGEQLMGDFCHKCGEKVIHPKHDYSFFEFIEQTIDGFTHFDLKFIKSFKHLLFKPGLLTKDFIEGRRVQFMRPIQIFIISSVLFYFFMPNSGSFYASYEGLRNGYKSPSFSLDNPIKYDINAKLKALVVEQLKEPATDSLINKKANAIYEKAHEKAIGMSKTYLFLIIPFWGLILYALFFKQNAFYVPHLIFALHAFSFFLILDMFFLITLFEIFKLRVVENSKHLLPFFLIVWVYIILAIKKVYNQKTIFAFLKGSLVYLALLVLLIFYRVFITVWALNL